MRYVVAISVVALTITGLPALSPAHAYPQTKAECDKAGGVWVVNNQSGFCFMKLPPEKPIKACSAAGGEVLRAADGTTVCGTRQRNGDPLKGLNLCKSGKCP